MHLVLYVLVHTPAKLSFVEYVYCNFLIAMNTFTFEHNLSMKIRCHKVLGFFFLKANYDSVEAESDYQNKF